MKKEYSRPGLSIYSFATEDVVTTSGTAGGTTTVTTQGQEYTGSIPENAKLFEFAFGDFT